MPIRNNNTLISYIVNIKCTYINVHTQHTTRDLTLAI